LATGSNDKLINIWKLSGNLVNPPDFSDNLKTDISVGDEENDIPFEFLCPITQDIMKFPVRCSGETICVNFFVNHFLKWTANNAVFGHLRQFWLSGEE
jgi:hypothetical protein